MSSLIAVTAADAGYFDLLRDLLLSLEAARAADAAGAATAMDLGFLDLGLSEEQLAWLAPRVTRVVRPGWDLALPDQLRRAKPFLRALTARPFLPRHFPGYDTYLWLDADVWVQRWQGIALFGQAARLAAVAAVPHTDRAYAHRPEVAAHRYRTLAACYGKAAADALIVRHYLNAGVFAARADSPLWAAWAEDFQQGLDASKGEVIDDQAALNHALLRRGLSAHLLPATCNWQSHLAAPAWQPRGGFFCEPFLPHAPIALMHLTHTTKSAVGTLAGLDGQRHRMTLRYPGGRQAAASAG